MCLWHRLMKLVIKIRIFSGAHGVGWMDGWIYSTIPRWILTFLKISILAKKEGPLSSGVKVGRGVGN